MKNKVFSIFFIASLLFIMPQFSNPTNAYTVNDSIAYVKRAIEYISTEVPSAYAEIGQWTLKQSEIIRNVLTANALTIKKVAALLAVQQATSLIIGEGNGGKGTIIRDFNDYLYISPQQHAMVQMNSFFNTVSRGRLSRLNYEGIGPNYDAYLVSQARMAIAGQPFTTNLQDLVTSPNQMFDAGNMKGLMTYMQCANNVTCYTMTSTARYSQEFAKAQEIAKNENDRGFMPKKSNGRITQPASIAQNALLQMDQLGTQIIMNAKGGDAAQNSAAMTQVWMGAGISAAARLSNYGISDEQGKAAIRNKNDQFPFSLGYSLNGGVGISAGGINISTGLAGVNGCLQIGNTAATGSASIDGLGNTYVDINGQRRQCPKNSNSSTVTKPSVTGTAPSATVGSETFGGDTISTP